MILDVFFFFLINFLCIYKRCILYKRIMCADSFMNVIQRHIVHACSGMAITVYLCLKPAQLNADGSWSFRPSARLLAAGSFKADHVGWVVGWCQKGNSNNSLPWAVSETQLLWCQAALSTVAGSHIPNNRPLQRTALPLSLLILCHALGLRWPRLTGWLHDSSQTHSCKKDTHTHAHTNAYWGLKLRIVKAKLYMVLLFGDLSVWQLLLAAADVWLITTAVMSGPFWLLND